MLILLLVSLIWAFSFGLIKGGLIGFPSSAAAFIRLAVALAVFAPFLRLRGLRASDALKLMITGAVQYGLMYVAYMYAFEHLKAYEVALFTVFTPIFVTIINDLFERRINPAALSAVALAVAGGFVIEYRQISSSELWKGFALMQGANLCFAFGQIFYRRIMQNLPEKQTDLQVFGLLYLGAAFTTALAATGTPWGTLLITSKQALTLLYLGIVASGLGFFLWNIGARKVSPGTLAVFNNLKIPLGILASVLFFGEKADYPRLLAGGALMVVALVVSNLKNARPSQNKPPGRLT
ncbi:MAG: EamA family transporter [Verrucomicrobia bacterium]|nr:EamA family transporter [Verrucomicrobiota bacterium]